jgi:hypothetical protein
MMYSFKTHSNRASHQVNPMLIYLSADHFLNFKIKAYRGQGDGPLAASTHLSRTAPQINQLKISPLKYQVKCLARQINRSMLLQKCSNHTINSHNAAGQNFHFEVECSAGE